MRRTQLLCFALVLSLCATASLADSITPSSMTWSVDIGDVINQPKTIQIDQKASAELDVFFLFDTTGSMVDLVEKAKNSASDIIDGIASAFGASNVGYGVGMYQDFPELPYGIPPGVPGFDASVPWALLQDITTDVPTAKAGLGSLPLVGFSVPDDKAESQLHALTMAANTVSWRTGSSRVLVWFGDAMGWDDDLWSAYPSDFGMADTLLALGSNNIIVEAISVGTAFGLDGSWDAFPPLGFPVTLGPGQGTLIATTTGGGYTDIPNPMNLSTAEFVQTIIDVVEAGFDDYTTVSLDVSAFPAVAGTIDFKVAGQPDWNVKEYVDVYDRTQTRTFAFDVRITVGGPNDVEYTFPIYGTLDGGRILTEWDRLIVGDPIINPNQIPEPSTIGLMGLGLLGVGIVVRRKTRK